MTVHSTLLGFVLAGMGCLLASAGLAETRLVSDPADVSVSAAPAQTEVSDCCSTADPATVDASAAPKDESLPPVAGPGQSGWAGFLSELIQSGGAASR